MKKAVVFLAYSRLEYFKKTLASWKQARDIDNWDFHAFLDPHPKTNELVNEITEFEKAINKKVNTYISPTWLGCGVSHFECLQRMFETLEYDFVIMAEDDIIVSDDVFNYFDKTSWQYSNDSTVLSINTHVYSVKSGKYITKDPWFNPWVWGTWKDRWIKTIKPTFDKDYTSGTDGAPTGWDCNLDLRVLKQNNQQCIYPPESISLHIGVDGRNSNIHVFQDLVSVGAGKSFREKNDRWGYEDRVQREEKIKSLYNLLLQRNTDSDSIKQYVDSMLSIPDIVDIIEESGEYLTLKRTTCAEVPVDIIPKFLSFNGEFSQELILFLPFINYLSKKGLLGDSTLEIQHGMECFYKHIDCKKITKNVQRKHMSVAACPEWLPWPSEFVVSSHPQMLFLDHRELFKESSELINLPSDKPLLIIHNKHNMEWETGAPVNFINGEALDAICSQLKTTYQIIYIRHGVSKLPSEYSQDSNTLIQTNEDRDVLKKHPEVLLFDDLYSNYKHLMDYNTFKGGLYAKCHKFISSQGGGSYQIACYSNSDIHILHIRGMETSFAYDRGLYKTASNPYPTLFVYSNNADLVHCVHMLT